MPTTEPPAELQAVIGIAREAAALALDHYGAVARQEKAGAEAVTEADRACQRLVARRLAHLHPEDGLIGEESDDGGGPTNRQPRSGSRVWVVDPIDGTNNYVAGLGAWAVCIGLLEEGRPVLGVVHDAVRGWTYAGMPGSGAWLLAEGSARPLSALPGPLAASSLLMLTSNLLMPGSRSLPAWVVRWLAVKPWKLRMLGSAALEAVQVGAGVAHGSVTLNARLWDVAAAAAVVLAAGGRVQRLDGSDFFPCRVAGYAGERLPFLAAAPSAAAELLDEIRRHGEPVAQGLPKT